MSVRVEHGDSREVIRTLPDASVDSCVTDPPYALVSIVKRLGNPNATPIAGGSDGRYARAAAGFMGKQWDTGETAFDPEFWAEVLRVMKPGAHLLAFGGTRTYHRLACAIEDAGFEIRDTIMWLYGSGFPKSHDVSKGIDRAAGAERVVVGANPNHRSVSGVDYEGVYAGGNTGAATVTAPTTDAARQWSGWGTALKPACEPIILARKPLVGTVASNVLQHGTGAINIDGCRIEAAGPRPWREPAVPRSGTGGMVYGDFAAEGSRAVADTTTGRWPANVIHDGSDEVLAAFPQSSVTGARTDASRAADVTNTRWLSSNHRSVEHTDEGSAARFFYSAKATAADRLGSKHPTVKPVDLMRYLCRLVTPPGGTVLDPFAGSGTTGMGCMAEGFDAILIEREAEYVADIHKRLQHVRGEDEGLFAPLADAPDSIDLFGSAAE